MALGTRRVRLVLLACALAWGARPAAPAAQTGWRWEVAPDAAFTRLDVTWVSEGFLPRELVLSNAAAAGSISLSPAPHPGAARLEPLTPGRWRVVDATSAAAPPRVTYTVDLAALEAAGGAGVRRVGRDLVTDPSAWLIAPARWDPERAARVIFRLPEGQEVSAPWGAEADGSWRVPHDAFAQRTRVALVARPGLVIARGGTALHVHVLDAPQRASAAGIERWLATALDTVATLWEGRFPVPRVQVLVEPVRPGGDPVVFGEATLAGGPAVLLLLSAAARDADLPGEWIAVHELTHLGQPWIVKDDAWFSEGFVTYYQELLRGRAGIFGEGRAWQALHEGFQRGRRRDSPRSIADDSAGMQATHAYHRVYWAGAALALRVDLALRAETGGRRSLDDAMRLWSEPRVTQRKGWRALELLALADATFGTRACVQSVVGRLASAEFPATDDLYAALGLVAAGTEVFLAPEHLDAPGIAEATRLRRQVLPLVAPR